MGTSSSAGCPSWREGKAAGMSLVGVGGGVGSNAGRPSWGGREAAGRSLVGVGGSVGSGQLPGGSGRTGGSETLLGPVTCRDGGMAGRRGQE